MSLPRLLVPLAAALIIAGLVTTLVLSNNQKPAPYADLLAIKQDAEHLAIIGKLSEAHERYRDLFAAAQSRPVKDAFVFDLIEDARVDQNRIYMILLNQQRPTTKGLLPTTQRASNPTRTALPSPPSDIGSMNPPIMGLAPAPRVPGTVPYIPPLTSSDNHPSIPPTTSITSRPATTSLAGTDDGVRKNDKTEGNVKRSTPNVQRPTENHASGDTSAIRNPPAATAPTLPAVTMRNPRPGLLIQETPREADNFSDASIGLALAKANEFLLSQMKDGELRQGKDVSDTYRYGLNSLVVYALLSSGQATHDQRLAFNSPFVRQMLERMKQHPMNSDRDKAQAPVTYARSLRATALALANRPEDRAALKDDVQWLIQASNEGAYTYDDRFNPRVIPADPRGAPRSDRERKPDARPGSLMPPGGMLGPGSRGTEERHEGTEARRHEGEGNVQHPTFNVQLSTDAAARDASQLLTRSPQHVAASSNTQLATRNSQLPFPGPLLDESGRPIQLVDGLHDPRTGRELIPGVIRLPPPPTEIFDPPHYLPDPYANAAFVWDNSNSQYAVMGVNAGAQAGIEVPDAYWAAVQKHWLASQEYDAQWPYRKDKPGGYLAMTAGGITSLLATHDWLEAPAVSKPSPRATPAVTAIDRALAWLEAGDNSVTVTGPKTIYLGYNLHALSRVGLSTGYKTFGAHDWYRELARKIVLSQNENGSWGKTDKATADTLIDTAFTVLFLARGRHPILMNKLRLDTPAKSEGPNVRVDRGAWNNHPRDLANLTAFASREFEHTVNWQTVSIDRDPSEWADAPILYLASHQALSLVEADLAKLRAFAMNGGMLFTQADTNADIFNLIANTQLSKKLFPEYDLKDLPIDSPIYTCHYVLPPFKRPRLRGVYNGSRLLWVHSPTDLAINWQQRSETTKREIFELGVNLFVYAAGKTELRNRIDTRHIPALAKPPSSLIPFVRLKYVGNWDPEPQAYPRFSRYLQWETSLGLDLQSIEILKLASAVQKPQHTLAHLTGTAAWSPSEKEVAALRDFVSAGGTLIVEAIGPANSPFAETLQSALLPQAFPDAKFEALPADHPMLHATITGMEDITPPRVRPYTLTKLGPDPKALPPIRQAMIGKGKILYLPLDTTSGLLGTNTWAIFGYEPSESQAIMKNIVLWHADQVVP